MQPPQSLWWSTLDSPVTARRPLREDLDVDVAIIGGGFTGLWTARELKRRDPSLRIVVLEKSVCGFGASGRNGGWASALYPLGDTAIINHFGMDDFVHQRDMLQRAVPELGDATREDNIDAHFFQGGTLTFARSDIQVERLQQQVHDAHERGLADEDLRWLDVGELYERGYVNGAHGATYSPHCARINPARLVRGLAEVNERLGVQIFEDSAVTRIFPGRRGSRPRVVTVGGSVRADYVVRATEGFTPTLPHQRRKIAPIYSLMIATEPLSQQFWDDAGFAKYETFADDRHLIIYGQRTPDDRIAFGGRGSPYHFGSTVEERFDRNEKVFAVLETTLRELFPSMDGTITHQWGGPLGMPRDLSPSVLVDHDSGMASAGGYTGDGVILSRVCAQALADLITSPDTESEYTRLTFVQHEGKSWEPEPLRWMGINVGLGLATWADHTEKRRGTTSRASHLLDRLFDQFPP
ncbi:MAG: NAD(P)/FAD-dependent oxidoreductase [Acidimicrobiales bacterium]